MLNDQHQWRKLLRWGYQNAPLPISAKRSIWRQVMTLKGLLDGGELEHKFKITNIPQKPEARRLILQQLNFNTTTEKVEISIIIPCHEQLGYTINCLQSISLHPPQASYELLVIDDASQKEDYAVLANIPGLNLIQNPVNLGFIESCNHAAKTAKGKYLYFLNNDTVLLAKSVDSLHQTFTTQAKTGLVGSKLLYPNGLLQEAGGIVWRDGSAWNYGRMQRSGDPRFNYLRSVDYCSGASIMVPRHLFLEINGFDTLYKPAYYEDTDLAMRLRHNGYAILYQPLSIVVHFEGISHGTDLKQGLKQHQLINSNKFLTRWAEKLKNHREKGKEPDLEKDRGIKRRALLIDKCSPTPDRDAGSVVLLNIMLLLRHLGYQPTFIPDNNYANQPPYTQLCQSLGIECLHAPYVTSIEQHLRKHGHRYDLVILFRPDLAHANWNLVKRLCQQARVIYYPHDLHYRRQKREADILGNKRLRRKVESLHKLELDNSCKADSTIVLSLEEQRELREQLPNCTIEYLPLILNTDYAPERRPKYGGANIVFIGSFNHTPNADAILWFANEIWPKLLANWPEAVFHVVGADPPPNITNLNGPQIKIHGFVEDLDSLLEKVQVAVVPLRFGSGMKGKVGTALRCGLPVVSTSIGSEGMPAIHDFHMLIADDANTFATALSNLLGSRTQWQRLSQGGLDFAKEEWGLNSSLQRLTKILQNLDLEVDPGAADKPVQIYPFSQ